MWPLGHMWSSNQYRNVNMSILAFLIHKFRDGNCPIDLKLGKMIPDTVRKSVRPIQTFFT